MPETESRSLRRVSPDGLGLQSRGSAAYLASKSWFMWPRVVFRVVRIGLMPCPSSAEL
jgi:hypothetical protein